MVDWCVSRIVESIQGLKVDVVGLVGISFKPDVDDDRRSPALEVKSGLELRGYRVVTSDPFVKGPTIVNLDVAASESDLLVIATSHSEYRSIGSKYRGKRVLRLFAADHGQFANANDGQPGIA
jgi:UDP-N-acetyl-D-mannosaminuronate dehydrogenase